MLICSPNSNLSNGFKKFYPRSNICTILWHGPFADLHYAVKYVRIMIIIMFAKEKHYGTGKSIAFAQILP